MHTPSHLPTARHPLLLPSLLLIALNSLWLITLTTPFIHLDDPNFITQNPYVRGGLHWNSFLWAFTTTSGDYWHPLTWISLSLDASLFGFAPWGYHLTNTLLHTGNALLVFAFFRSATGNIPRSLFAAILFSLHPERVESVAWATERKDVLSACFSLLAMLAYLRYVRRPNAPRYLLICLCFFLGFLAKPILVMFPVLLLLLDIWPLNRFSLDRLWPLIREKLPIFLLALDGAINAYMQVLAKGTFRATLTTRVQNCVMNYFFYLRDFFSPTQLSLFYRAPAAFPLWQVVAAALLLLAIFVGVVLACRARYAFAAPLAVGCCWFVIAIFPTSGILQAGYSMRGDRFTYLPALGLILALLWGVAPAISLLRRPLPAIAAAALITGAMSLCTIDRLLLWRDPMALYQHDLALDEQNAYLHALVGSAAQDRGQTQLAIEHFRRAAELDSDFIAPPTPPPQTAPATAP